MAGWYFSPEELKDNSPSRKDGMDVKQETYLRLSYCTFLEELSLKLKLPHSTFAIAITLCQRYFFCQSLAKNDWKIIATACMLLAGKVDGNPRWIRHVVITSYTIIHKENPAAVRRIILQDVYKKHEELVLLGEMMVLKTTNFDLDIGHPYQTVVDIVKKLKVAQNDLDKVASNFVNDGFRMTSLCLQYKPSQIAAVAVVLAAQVLKVQLPRDGKKPWWEEYDANTRQIVEISDVILGLYVGHNSIKIGGTTPEKSSVCLKRMREADHVAEDRETEVKSPESAEAENSEKKCLDQGVDKRPGVLALEALKKMDFAKIKGAMKKRRNLGAAFTQKPELMDGNELIEREIERGVEMAYRQEKTSKAGN